MRAIRATSQGALPDDVSRIYISQTARFSTNLWYNQRHSQHYNSCFISTSYILGAYRRRKIYLLEIADVCRIRALPVTLGYFHSGNPARRWRGGPRLLLGKSGFLR